jgi:hypothetical protein
VNATGRLERGRGARPGPTDDRRRRPVGGLVVAGLALLVTLGALAALGSATPLGPAARPAGAAVGTALDPSAPPATVAPQPIVQLTDQAEPSTICDQGLAQCPAGQGASQVVLQAQAGVKGQIEWPAVQVAFLLEMTPYDGVYDPSAVEPGADPCGDAVPGSSALCDESNLVPFFVQYAGTIAEELQAQSPNSTLSFAMADYFATHDAWDSGGGSRYRVDVSSFVNATEFGGAVHEDFGQKVLGGGSIIPGSDLTENFLTSDSISALYQALLGLGGLNWSDSAHHVIVQIGSTAPRAPSYPEDYCVSPAVTPLGLTNCTASECEPAFSYPGNASPECEGWVGSTDGNVTDSIAALAHDAPACTGSLGGNCTIDEIDVNDTPTDPWSTSWSASGGAGGPANWTADAGAILQSGCDMAVATGGSWEGPSWFDCRALHVQGDLVGVPFGDPENPHTSNPTLLGAFLHVGYGEVPTPLVASGANRPMFEFVPWGNFGPSFDPSWAVTCVNATGVNERCPSQPEVLYENGLPVYGWNWSNLPATNAMHLGDRWTAAFFVSSYGPPFGLLPIDSCTTSDCLAAGSNEVDAAFTSMSFREYGSQNVVTESFQLMEVTLDPLTNYGVPLPPAPPVLPGPAPSSPPPTAPTVVPPTPAPPIPAAVISVEAAAAGFIAAGWTALGVRYPPQATKQASFSGALGKKRRRPPGGARIPLHWA